MAGLWFYPLGSGARERVPSATAGGIVGRHNSFKEFYRIKPAGVSLFSDLSRLPLGYDSFVRYGAGFVNTGFVVRFWEPKQPRTHG